jgi:hypothetical protein
MGRLLVLDLSSKGAPVDTLASPPTVVPSR